MTVLCKKLMLGFIALLFIISPAYSFFPNGENTEGDVIVVLRPMDKDETISASSLNNFGLEAFRTASFAASSGAWVRETYPELSETSNSVYALLRSEKKSAKDLTKELMNNPEVLAVCPNYKVYAAVVPNDTYIESCWGLDYINAPEVWENENHRGSSDVYVAVIDSGIDFENPDLQANIDYDYSSGQDRYGHGTHVSGIIGAVGNNSKGIAGVNWNVKIISIKALGDDGSGTIADVISALNYVTSLIRKEQINIRAVNMSFETYLTLAPTHDNLVRFPLWRAFRELDNENTAVMVAAAGNHSQTIGQPSTGNEGGIEKGYYVYPASFQGLNNFITVGALSRDQQLASFSNKGADILAPGVDILSTWLQSSTKYIRDDGVSLYAQAGTSMAAPYVTGAVALLSSINPNLTAYQLKNVLLKGGVKSSSVNASATNGLDLESAVTYQETYAENTNVLPASPVSDSYSDYTEYTPSTETGDEEGNNNNNTGSSGCNASDTSVRNAIFSPLMILSLLLVKKINS